VTPGFDVDEIGFQRTSDWVLLAGSWTYDRFAPGRPIRHWSVGSDNLGLGWTWAGESRARVVDAYASVDTHSYWTFKLTATRELTALSTEWLRGGPALLLPPRSSLALSVLTDQRRPSYVSLDARATREPESGSSGYSLSPLLNLRCSDRLQASLGPSWQVDTVGWQYVGRTGSVAAPVYLVGRVHQQTLALALRADLTLSPRLAVQLYTQPFATRGRYDRYQTLQSPRDPVAARRFAPLAAEEGPQGPGEVPDGRLRSLNGSLVLRWEYRPASFLTVAWNQERSTASGDTAAATGSLLAGVLGDRPTNVLIVKLSRRFGS
jgi:hypothetical protein